MMGALTGDQEQEVGGRTRRNKTAILFYRGLLSRFFFSFPNDDEVVGGVRERLCIPGKIEDYQIGSPWVLIFHKD